jgi:hypothetical protein
MKTVYRTAAHAKRNRIQDLDLPKFWRPKLEQSAQFQAKLTHWDLISRFTDGTANPEDLWDWMETGFTYSQIMRLLIEDGSEFTDEAMQAMAEQLDSYPAVIARFRTTGRVGFNGAQLNIARAAAHVMDGLIDMDRHGIAQKAARWSIEQMARIRGMVSVSENGLCVSQNGSFDTQKALSVTDSMQGGAA